MNSLIKSFVQFLYRYSPFLNILVSFSAIAYCLNVADFSDINGASLSWYGRFSDTALVFNGGAFISGVLNLMFAHRVYGAVRRLGYRYGTLIGGILVVASLGSFGVAFIPVPWYHEEVVLRFAHTFAAGMSLFLWPVAGMFIGYGKNVIDDLEVSRRLRVLRIAIWIALIAFVLGIFIVTRLGGGFWEYELLLGVVIPVIITGMWWFVEGVLEARTKKI